MSTPSPAQALTEEFSAKRRQFVLDNTQARWRIVGCGVVFLIAARLAHLTGVSWAFIVAFTASFAGINYAIARVVRERAFRTWYAHANIAVGAAMISTVAYAIGPSGDLLFPAYLISPFQAAYYLGPIEAWESLALGVAGFGLVTAIIPGTWGWVSFVKEVLVLVFVSVAIIPTMLSIVARVRSTREVLAQAESGDLTSRAADGEHDEVGYLAATVNRTIDAIGRTVGDAQRHAAELDAAGRHSTAAEAAASRLAKIIQRFRVSDPTQVVARGTELRESSGRSK